MVSTTPILSSPSKGRNTGDRCASGGGNSEESDVPYLSEEKEQAPRKKQVTRVHSKVDSKKKKKHNEVEDLESASVSEDSGDDVSSRSSRSLSRRSSRKPKNSSSSDSSGSSEGSEASSVSSLSSSSDSSEDSSSSDGDGDRKKLGEKRSRNRDKKRKSVKRPKVAELSKDRRKKEELRAKVNKALKGLLKELTKEALSRSRLIEVVSKKMESVKKELEILGGQQTRSRVEHTYKEIAQKEGLAKSDISSGSRAAAKVIWAIWKHKRIERGAKQRIDEALEALRPNVANKTHPRLRSFSSRKINDMRKFLASTGKAGEAIYFGPTNNTPLDTFISEIDDAKNNKYSFQIPEELWAEWYLNFFGGGLKLALKDFLIKETTKTSMPKYEQMVDFVRQTYHTIDLLSSRVKKLGLAVQGRDESFKAFTRRIDYLAADLRGSGMGEDQVKLLKVLALSRGIQSSELVDALPETLITSAADPSKMAAEFTRLESYVQGTRQSPKKPASKTHVAR